MGGIRAIPLAVAEDVKQYTINAESQIDDENPGANQGAPIPALQQAPSTDSHQIHAGRDRLPAHFMHW
jgi:hypothetical protein